MTIKGLLTAACILWALAAFSQDSLEIRPIPPRQSEQKEDRVAVGLDDVPPKMRQALGEDDRYAGWENGGNLYYEKSTDQFLLHVVSENKTRTYRFDREGNVILSGGPPREEESNR